MALRGAVDSVGRDMSDSVGRDTSGSVVRDPIQTQSVDLLSPSRLWLGESELMALLEERSKIVSEVRVRAIVSLLESSSLGHRVEEVKARLVNAGVITLMAEMPSTDLADQVVRIYDSIGRCSPLGLGCV